MHMGDQLLANSLVFFKAALTQYCVCKKWSMQLICNTSLGAHKKVKSYEGEGKLCSTIYIILHSFVQR